MMSPRGRWLDFIQRAQALRWLDITAERDEYFGQGSTSPQSVMSTLGWQLSSAERSIGSLQESRT